MANRKVRICGIGSSVPPRVLTNADLEEMVDTSNEWIVTRTGIRERHIADDGVATSHFAIEAAHTAMERAGVTPDELDAIIVGTATPDMFFPSTACFVQQGLGARKAAVFDISAACSGFLYGLEVARGLILTGGMETVLVIGGETLSRILDWTDRATCVLFGDGAGAAILRQEEGERGILASFLGGDGSLGDLLKMPGGGSLHPATHETIEQRLHCVKMRGNELFKHAVRAMYQSAKEVLSKANLTVDDVDYLFTHQANIRIIDATARRLGIPKEKVFVNIDRFGNTSAGSIPIALDDANSQGLLKEGDLLVLVAFGAGLTWAATALRW
jgi:3-oxoacyl-[acyl-carrier-protein] synthase-3